MSDRTATLIEKAQVHDRTVEIRWIDGHTSLFHAIWLRHQCGCSFCGSPLDGLRGIRLREIPDDIAATELISIADGLEIVWSDEHRSHYDASWLRNHCYSKSEREARRHVPTLWDTTLGDSIPTADFVEVEAEAGKHLSMLKSICDYGVCRITNAPIDIEQGLRVLELIGPQRQTNHGSFPLMAKRAVDNVGDASFALDPHVDEPYRLNGIGITVFQVIQPAPQGGETTLVDGFEVARRLRAEDPDGFQLLATTPITCHRVEGTRNAGRVERRYATRLPIIRLDSEGETSGIRLNERQISPLDMDADLVEPYYRALRLMLDITYDPELMITLPLAAGEGLFFNNQRVLHGRTEFDADQEPRRSVVTRSVDLDDFYSTIRTLSAAIGEHSRPMVYVQGMAG